MGCGVSDFVAPMTFGMMDVAGGVTGTEAATAGAEAAARTQAQAAEKGITEQRRQFDAIVEMMAPYLEAGTGALGAQQELIGLGAPGTQAAAIEALKASPQYGAMIQSGEEAMLQRASATGGLRGGDIQGALATFRPQILSQLIESQYGKLGGLSAQGQQAAGLQAGAGTGMSANVANLLAQQGAATAGGQLAAGQQQQQTFQNLLGLGGIAAGIF